MSCSWVRWHADFCCCTETSSCLQTTTIATPSWQMTAKYQQQPWHSLLPAEHWWQLNVSPPHTHNHFMALLDFVCDYRVSQHQKDKTNMDLLEQETVSGSSISWAICKSAPWLRHITMPASHHSVFLQAGCPSCCPTNSIKALKAVKLHEYIKAT